MALSLALVAGCAQTNALGIKSLPKGEQIEIRTLLAKHAGQRACVEYDAATNSCASLVRGRISGNTLIAREVVVLSNPVNGKPQRFEIVTRSTLRDGQACVTAQGITAGRNSDDLQFAQLLVQVTQGLVQEAGGEVCATYFASGDAYVVSSRGVDGKAFPPGDTSFQFVSGRPSLRQQY